MEITTSRINRIAELSLIRRARSAFHELIAADWDDALNDQEIDVDRDTVTKIRQELALLLEPSASSSEYFRIKIEIDSKRIKELCPELTDAEVIKVGRNIVNDFSSSAGISDEIVMEHCQRVVFMRNPPETIPTEAV
jgi:hypothetical protein